MTATPASPARRATRFAKADRRVSVFYFYVWDDEFGPGFIKICTYFPYPAKVWLNGHEWAKRQATKAGIGFTELANGFGSCDDPAALQAICDRLGPADIDAFFDRWMTVIPTPLSDDDRDGGYWWELSMRQIEVSRTIVFDQPRRGRAFFEAVVADNIGLGRPSEVRVIFGRKIHTQHQGHVPHPGRDPRRRRVHGRQLPRLPHQAVLERRSGAAHRDRRQLPRRPRLPSVASTTSTSSRPRPAPPTPGCSPCNKPVRTVPSRPRCSNGSHSPRSRRANESPRCGSGTPASWP